MRKLGVLWFSIGLLLGMAVSGGVLWGDLEASLFDSALGADEPLKTLRCPVILTSRETGTVSATFTNPGDRAVVRLIRAHISNGFVTLMREVSDRLALEPGETRKLEWTVTPDDAAWGHFILVRVHVLRSSPLPSYTGSCGVLVMNLPGLTGNQIIVLTLLLSALSTMAGVALVAAGSRPPRGRAPGLIRGMGSLAVLGLATLLSSLVGWWMAGILLLLLTLIVAVSIIGWSVARVT